MTHKPRGASHSARKEYALNFNPNFRHAGFTPSLADILLADVAIRIQLSKTDHDKANDRFETMQDWIDRQGSPLRGLVSLLYPQGSMAVGSTVARVSDKDEYDIDIIADLAIRQDANPQTVLDTLHDAIRGEKGSRYWGKTIRHTRCVCVSYDDGMHIDLTPAVRLTGMPDRTSVIFHSKPEDPAMPDRRLWANPWGMADWFNSQTRIEADFAKFYEERADDYYAGRVHARAPAEDVPDRKPAHSKSRALIALQLIKRWRNVLFDRRDRAKMRRPPSVLLTKMVGDNANRTKSLAEELEHQASCMLARFEYEVSKNRKIVEVNPRCPQDLLTDRWPESIADQKLMIEDLKVFIAKIRLLRSGALDLAKMTEVLEGLFGQRPVRKAVDDYIDSMAIGRTSRVVTSSGRVLAPAAGVAMPATARAIPHHTNFGDS
jgi:hypothetical protein